MNHKKTLVLGGSLKPQRFSNKAIHRLRAYGHPVVSIGLRGGRVEDVDIVTGFPVFDELHTITVYLNPLNQEPYRDYLIGLHPTRIIFNPGTENSDFARQCTAAGIEVVENCTLVMLDAGIY